MVAVIHTHKGSIISTTPTDTPQHSSTSERCSFSSAFFLLGKHTHPHSSNPASPAYYCSNQPRRQVWCACVCVCAAAKKKNRMYHAYYKQVVLVVKKHSKHPPAMPARRVSRLFKRLELAAAFLEQRDFRCCSCRVCGGTTARAEVEKHATE